MNYSDEALTFACEHDTLFGILSRPEYPTRLGVIVIVGGPQYRAGSHRQFVLLSRFLAVAGFPVLRFDYRGMGDSSGSQRNFCTVSADVNAAIGAMQIRLPSVSRFVLWGLCDGASAALLYCHHTNDQRISGLCLLNPWVRSDASLARAQVKHYYLQRLKQKAFWIKFLRGQGAIAALAGLWRNIRLMRSADETTNSAKLLPFQQQMARAWRSFDGDILLVLSGKDYTAKEFLENLKVDSTWAGLLEKAQVIRHDMVDADHTFSDSASRLRVEALTLTWLQTRVPH